MIIVHILFVLFMITALTALGLAIAKAIVDENSETYSQIVFTQTAIIIGVYTGILVLLFGFIYSGLIKVCDNCAFDY